MASRGGSRWFVSIVAAVAAAAPATISHAGAWPEEAGHGQIVATMTATTGDQAFLAGGGIAAMPPYRKYEGNAYVEYGLTGWLTAIADPDLLSVRSTMPAAAYDGLGPSGGGIRARIWHAAASVLSLQAMVYVPGTRRLTSPAQLGYADAETDRRILYGRSFSLGRWSGFTDVEIAYRTRAGSPADEAHIDLTLGIRPAPRLMVMLQSFSTITVGAARAPFLPGRWTKIEASLVYDLTPAWSVQLGGLTTVLGVNALRERGFVAGLWRRF